MMARVMLENGYEPGMGLGKAGAGMVNMLEITENRGRFGLGYKSTSADKRRITMERKEKCLAHLQGRESRVERVLLYPINESFKSAGWIHADQVAMLKEEADDDTPDWVQPCAPDFELKNWKIIEQPKVFISDLM